MKNIDITTYATWIKTVGFFETHNSDLNLEARIKNNTFRDIQITSICISLKRNYILFTRYSDIKKKHVNYLVKPKSESIVKLDIRHILQYGTSKKFTVKLFTSAGIYESDILTINSITESISSYI